MLLFIHTMGFSKINKIISTGNSMICSDMWPKYHE